MEQWRKDARKEPIIIDIDSLVPADHLLRKIEKVMDYEWLYERLDPYYCHDNGRPGTDPVVLIKMVLIQHLFGIPSLRQTHREIQVNLAYRWFLGYGLLDEIPHFATVSHAFCKRFPEELATEIFEHILNKALNNRMVDPGTIFIDGTHIKASANKKKYQKEQVRKRRRSTPVSCAGRSTQSEKSWLRNPLKMMRMIPIPRTPPVVKLWKRRYPQQIRTAECS